MTKIKDLPRVDRAREIKKQCAVCGNDILIKVFPNGKYTGGNYFGVTEKTESYRETSETMDLGDGLKAHIAEPIGKITKSEYWECSKCYNEAYKEAKQKGEIKY